MGATFSANPSQCCDKENVCGSLYTAVKESRIGVLIPQSGHTTCSPQDKLNNMTDTDLRKGDCGFGSPPQVKFSIQMGVNLDNPPSIDMHAPEETPLSVSSRIQPHQTTSRYTGQHTSSRMTANFAGPGISNPGSEFTTKTQPIVTNPNSVAVSKVPRKSQLPDRPPFQAEDHATWSIGPGQH